MRFRLPGIRKLDGKAALALGLGLGQADRAPALFPLTALLEDFDAFKALEYRAVAGGATADFQAVMLGHGSGGGLSGAGT